TERQPCRHDVGDDEGADVVDEARDQAVLELGELAEGGHARCHRGGRRWCIPPAGRRRRRGAGRRRGREATAVSGRRRWGRWRKAGTWWGRRRWRKAATRRGRRGEPAARRLAFAWREI